MDLGFGNSNQKVGTAATSLLLQTAKVQEKALEDEAAAYDALLDDDEALAVLRQKRLAQMKQDQINRQQWKVQGHGEYTELAGSDVTKLFFEATKQSKQLVVHFYRPTTILCDTFHAHLDLLAKRHMETRFLKINVDGCDQGNGGSASYLVHKLGIVIMPTLVLVNDRKVVHQLRGCDELGGNPEFSTKALEYVLGVHGAIQHDSNMELPAELLPENQLGVNAMRIRGTKRTGGPAKSSIRDGISSGRFDDEDYF